MYACMKKDLKLYHIIFVYFNPGKSNDNFVIPLCIYRQMALNLLLHTNQIMWQKLNDNKQRFSTENHTESNWKRRFNNKNSTIHMLFKLPFSEVVSNFQEVSSVLDRWSVLKVEIPVRDLRYIRHECICDILDSIHIRSSQFIH